MFEAFYRHLFPGRIKVLGRELPPLSLWHLAALEAIDSPLIGRSGRVELADIQVAVRICRTRWPKPPRIFDWAWREKWQALLHRRDHRYVREQAEYFTAYLQVHCASPKFWEAEGETGKFLSAPSVLARVSGLVQLGCFSLAEIWNDFTPGFTTWLLSAVAERSGSGQRFVADGEDVATDDDGTRSPETEADVRALMKANNFTPEAMEAFVEKWKARQRRGEQA